MAKIHILKKIIEGVKTAFYPLTIPQAVIDPASGKSARAELDEKANHGYESNPKTLKSVADAKADHGYDVEETQKTLKEVDTLATQNAEDITQLAGEMDAMGIKIVGEIPNGDFSNGLTGWTLSRCTGIVADGILTLTGNSSAVPEMRLSWSGDLIAGHKYYVAASVETVGADWLMIYLDYFLGATSTIKSIVPVAGEKLTFVETFTPATSGSGSVIQLRFASSLTGVMDQSAKVYGDIVVIDMTLVFGDSEPTKEEVFDILQFAASAGGVYDFDNGIIPMITKKAEHGYIGTPKTLKTVEDELTADINTVTEKLMVSEIHPSGRDTDTFVSSLGFGWYAENDSWFDRTKMIDKLVVRSSAASYIDVGIFSINGTAATKIASKNVLLAIGINELNLSQIMDDPSLVADGERYYIFCKNLGNCITYKDIGVANTSLYIDPTTEAETVARPYVYSFWLKTSTSLLLQPDEKLYLMKEPIIGFDVQEEISTKDYVFIPPGIHIVSSKLVFKSNQTIEGIPGKSIIQFANSALTIMSEMYNLSNVKISGVIFEGMDADVPLAGNDVAAGVIDSFTSAIALSGNGTHVGMHVYGCKGIVMEDVKFRNFNSYGLWMRTDTADYFDAFDLRNILVHDCYVGVHVSGSGEYGSFSGIKANRNQIGMIMNAGNNTVVASHFDGNRVGLMLLDYVNGAHGSFGTMTCNHNSLFGLIANNVALSELFTGCHFWHSDIYVKNSKGLVFGNCVFANNDIYADGNYAGGGMWMITDSLFRDGTTTINHDYNGNVSNLILKNNYYMSGSDSTGLNN